MSHTPDIAMSFIILGGLLLAGLGAQWLGQKTAIPRVTLLIALGIAVGPAGADILGDVAERTFPWITHITLALVGFLLGGKLHKRFLDQQGPLILSSSLQITIITWLLVTLACGWFTGNWPAALLLGAIATATDPAATHDVIKESGKQNAFTDRLLGIVSLDDVWGLLLFSVSLSIAGFLLDTGFDTALQSLWELFGAIALGAFLGLPIAWITGRSSAGEPQLIEALGAVILCAGLAAFLEVSYLLACIVMGMTVTNVARHHTRPFHAIEQIEWPFMMLFFILAGASLDFVALEHLGWLGVVYAVARIGGRLVGGVVFSTRRKKSPAEGVALGSALMPQAGVAIGIALIGAQTFPELAPELLATAIAATVFFELIGPPLTRRSLEYMDGKIDQGPSGAESGDGKGS
jgi:Kef-type K+ transport system membrane component KefB